MIPGLSLGLVEVVVIEVRKVVTTIVVILVVRAVPIVRVEMVTVV